jgi:hypothetical protein
VTLKLSGSIALAFARATPPIADNPPSKVQGCMIKISTVRNKYNKIGKAAKKKRKKEKEKEKNRAVGRRKSEVEKEWPLLNL